MGDHLYQDASGLGGDCLVGTTDVVQVFVWHERTGYRLRGEGWPSFSAAGLSG